MFYATYKALNDILGGKTWPLIILLVDLWMDVLRFIRYNTTEEFSVLLFW